MKVTYILTAAAIALSVRPADAQQQPSTSFTFWTSIAGVQSPVSFPTPDGMRITLPVAYMRWNCMVTPGYVSDDGKQFYHNIVCSNVDDNAIVGVSVYCSRFQNDRQQAGFFLRDGSSKNTPNVELWGGCITSASTAPATVGHKL